MATYLVTRHPGAAQWLRDQLATPNAVALEHLHDIDFKPGDQVCGVLPLNWAARICRQGAHAWIISCEVPQSMRGRELSADELRLYGARLVRYHVVEVGTDCRN